MKAEVTPSTLDNLNFFQEKRSLAEDVLCSHMAQILDEMTLNYYWIFDLRALDLILSQVHKCAYQMTELRKNGSVLT